MAPTAVLHLDAALLAVDKPAGRLVIPGRDAGEPSLRADLEAAHGPLWVVHRLDRGTSGVLLFARSAAAHRALNLAFERGEPEKTYLALVAGLPPEDARVALALAPARRGRMRPARPDEPGAKEAATRFRVLAAFPARVGRPAAALVEATPETGRTHQIRVHLRSLGHPLLLDPDYGEPGPVLGEGGAVVLARTPLHAARLVLAHPDGGRLALEAPLPADLEVALAWLRG
ncbi:MAG: RluA family pseudouridine synthase [Anaeromyxobacter sp.]|nr:RluA family pseudouridine synthase [Anaeromyxobacter sp.]MBL0277722.1 RluA family pseudouridine synthase [Anaeromyxobacter sp.]